jgi:glutamate dehydrogenase (NAD(P)+)
MIIGPEQDILAPGVNADEKTMAWVMDAYSKHMGHSVPGITTGKPVEIGGSLLRQEATGKGCVITILETLKDIGLEIEDLRVAVHGYGNVGYTCATLLQEAGARVVAVCDSESGLYDEQGLDTLGLKRLKRDGQPLAEYESNETIKPEEVLEVDCDLLIPAALENCITTGNADRITARVIAEGANGPITPEADDILEDRGITVIPDILANSGGVIVSYFEWVQNIQNMFWPEFDVERRMTDIMNQSYHEVYHLQRQRRVSLRIAAFIMAMDRVARATSLRQFHL